MKIAARLSLELHSHVAPDIFIHNKNTFNVPHDSFVISRSAEGQIITRYGDDFWDLTSYSKVGSCVLHWNTWSSVDSPLKHAISNNMKLLCFSLLYFNKSRLSAGTIRAFVTDLRVLAKLALSANCTIAEATQSNKFLKIYKTTLSSASRSAVQGMSTLIVKLLDIQSRHPELGFCFSSKLFDIPNYFLEITPKKTKQTPLIPTQVYSELITRLDELINDVLQHSSKIHEIFQIRNSDSYYGFGFNFVKQRPGNPLKHVDFATAIAHHGLIDFCSRNKISDNLSLNAFLTLAQTACKCLVHIFTGMRDTEGRLLPYDSFKSVRTPQGLAFIFEGFTSKMTGNGDIPTYWISCQEAESAYKCAQAIADIYFTKHKLETSRFSRLPLFPSSVFGFGKPHPGYKIPLAKLASDSCTELSKLINVRIRANDLNELEDFDSFRDWRSEKEFQVGEVWMFSSHQARRALAVYAARSGLVSIGALSLQFKHITQAMTCYYSSNSSFAVNFVQSKSQQELVEDLNTEMRIAQFIAFDSEIIKSSSQFFGGEGTRIQNSKINMPIRIDVDRNLTKKKFLNGEMAFRPSPLASCASVTACTKISFTSVLTCIGCASSIVKSEDRSKFLLALRSIRLKMKLFEPGSPFMAQLEHEEATIARILERITQSGES